MGDLFHEDVPDEWIDHVFAIMALCPQHTFQVLTKRADRMRDYMSRAKARILGHALERCDEGPNGWWRVGGSKSFHRVWWENFDEHRNWPLSNVWLGVSVEDQPRADERLPLLLQTQAAVRFVSAEPLLGPVDLSRWASPKSPWQLELAPNTWAQFQWPDWIPDDIRGQIERFWCPEFGRGPKSWLQDMRNQDAPPTGARARVRLFGRDMSRVEGRFVHAWNNIGRVRLDDGSWHCCSFCPAYNPKIDWVICGGESGAGARPMDPEWARSLRDQCDSAGVPFFFKQWGGRTPKAGGRELDGRIWDAMPRRAA